MKRLTGFVVITLFVVFGYSAAFGEGLATFGLLDSTQSFLYCDYWNFSYGTSLASGIDVAAGCPGNDGTLIGVVTSISGPFPVTGPIVMLGANSEDAFYGFYSGYQGIIVSQTKASKNHFGWEVFYNFYDSFDFYLTNYGYLTNKLPPLGPLAEGPSAKAATPATVMAISHQSTLKK
ncbi:MAG: hypothetical protein WA172_01950 [Terriglobales bacterium]